MKPILLCMAALVLPACAATTADPTPAHAPAPSPPPPPTPPSVATGAVPADCPLTVGFSSYAMGIDRAAHQRVIAHLAGDRGVSGFQAHGWGREGEVTLCVRPRSPADTVRLFNTIRAMLPARPRGPITLRTRSGLRYQAPPRR
jgi:hypothetical protein